MSNSRSSHIYRVDKFIVPAASRDEFLTRANAARDILKQQAGFVGSTYLEQFGGPGEFNIVAIAEWSSQAHANEAKGAIAVLTQQSNIEPQDAFQRRLGIRSDLGFYKEIGA
jgi:hypothetical protein